MESACFISLQWMTTTINAKIRHMTPENLGIDLAPQFIDKSY